MSCPRCGYNNISNMNFCPSCGTDLRKSYKRNFKDQDFEDQEYTQTINTNKVRKNTGYSDVNEPISYDTRVFDKLDGNPDSYSQQSYKNPQKNSVVKKSYTIQASMPENQVQINKTFSNTAPRKIYEHTPASISRTRPHLSSKNSSMARYDNTLESDLWDQAKTQSRKENLNETRVIRQIPRRDERHDIDFDEDDYISISKNKSKKRPPQTSSAKRPPNRVHRNLPAYDEDEHRENMSRSTAQQSRDNFKKNSMPSKKDYDYERDIDEDEEDLEEDSSLPFYQSPVFIIISVLVIMIGTIITLETMDIIDLGNIPKVISSIGGNKKTDTVADAVYDVGGSASVGDNKVSLVSFEASEDDKHIITTISITNTGDSSILINPFHFSLINNSGDKSDPLKKNKAPEIENLLSDNIDLDAGETLSFNLVFDKDKKAKSLYLAFNPDNAITAPIAFELSK